MGTFQLCFNTSTIRPTAIQDKIRIAAAAGYGAVELWNDDLTGFERTGGRLAEIRDMVEDAGLLVPDVVHLSGWMEADEAVYKGEVLGEARRKMEQGAAVGAPRIIVGPAHGTTDLARAADRYLDLMALGQEIGCLPALEFLGFVTQVKDVDTLMQIVQRANHPDTTVVLDAFHIYRGGGRDEDILKVPGEQIAIFHIDDAPAAEDRPLETFTDGDRVYPGEGILDLRGMLQKLKAQGFSGPVSLELFNARLYMEDPMEVAVTGADRVRALIESV